MNRYFSHPRRGERRMFGMNLGFLDEKVPKHKLALSVWVECKLFKEKNSKTGLKHRGCIWRIGWLSCYRPRGNRYSHTYVYAFLESFSLKKLIFSPNLRCLTDVGTKSSGQLQNDCAFSASFKYNSLVKQKLRMPKKYCIFSIRIII